MLKKKNIMAIFSFPNIAYSRAQQLATHMLLPGASSKEALEASTF